jgi:hypothetical protein
LHRSAELATRKADHSERTAAIEEWITPRDSLPPE